MNTPITFTFAGDLIHARPGQCLHSPITDANGVHEFPEPLRIHTVERHQKREGEPGTARKTVLICEPAGPIDRRLID